MQTVVVNIKMERFDVYIGRAGRGQDGYFGNPFHMGPGISREEAIKRFQGLFAEGDEKGTRTIFSTAKG
jgi:hypothetical protein